MGPQPVYLGLQSDEQELKLMLGRTRRNPDSLFPDHSSWSEYTALVLVPFTPAAEKADGRPYKNYAYPLTHTPASPDIHILPGREKLKLISI